MERRETVTNERRFGTAKAALVAAGVLLLGLPAPTAAQVPGAPIGVSATPSGNIVILGWSPPNGGAQVTGYAIDAGTSSGATNVAANYVVGNVLGVASPPLPAGTYFVRLKAYNQFGPGPVSTEVMFTIAGPAPPGPPTNMAASVTGLLVTATWAPPVTGGTPTEYLVDAGTGPGASNLANGLSVGASLGAAANLPAATYYIRARARNAYGTSGPSAEVAAVVGASGPPGAPTNFDFTVLGGAVQLRWNAPATGGAPTGYIIEAGSNPGLADLATLQVGNVTSTAVNAPNGTYFVRVRAFNLSGPSGPSNEQVITASPSACVGAFAATLTWNTGSVSGSPYQVDMDLHVREPGNVHVWYASPLGTTLQLDDDNTIAFGPENICSFVPAANGTYEVYVVAYSGNQWPTTARVTVRSNVGTPSEQYTVITRTFTGANSSIAQNVATVTYPGGVITETTGTRSPFFQLLSQTADAEAPKQK